MRRTLGIVVAVALLLGTGCQKPAPPAAAVAPATPMLPGKSPAAESGERPARTLITSSPLDIDSNAPFAQFSQRIAQARQDQKTLPCGHSELDRLYEMVVTPGFQGAADPQEVNQQLNQWVSEDTADPTPQIALARAALHAAYVARGDEHADVLSDKRRQRFELLLRDAHNRAREALTKGTDDPEVYRLLIATGYELRLPAGEMAMWLEDGPKLYPKYHPLYDVLAKIFAERKTGQMPELVRLANQALEQQSGDEGLEVYTRIALAVNRADPRALVNSGFDLDRLHAGARLLLQRYPEAAMFVDFIGVVAYLTEDFALGNEILPELESRTVDLKHWDSELRFNQFKTRLKLPMPQETPELRMWAGPEGGASLVFIDEGKYLAITPNDEQSSVTVWPVNDANQRPTVVKTARRIGSQLDADRRGQRLMVYSINQREMVASSFDLSQGTTLTNFAQMRQYKPRFEIAQNDPSSDLGRRWSVGFFEISEDGRRAVAVSGGQVELFDPATGETIKRFSAPGMNKFEKWGRQLSSDGKLLAMQGDNGFEIWDCEEGTKLFDLSEKIIKTHYILSPIHLQPDRSLLLHVIQRTSGVGEITLANWDPDSLQLKHVGPIGRRLVPLAALGNEYVACASQGQLGSNQELAIYRLSDGKCLRTIKGHVGSVLYASFAPDGSWIASMDRLGPAKVWRVPQP